MSRKRLVVRNRRKRKLYFSILLVCLLIIGVGYANFGTELDILGLLGIKGYRLPINTTWDYDYKEEIQTFRVPQDGIYRLDIEEEGPLTPVKKHPCTGEIEGGGSQR